MVARREPPKKQPTPPSADAELLKTPTRVIFKEASAKQEIGQQQKAGKGLLEAARSERRALAELILVAIVIGLGINIIAGLLLMRFQTHALFIGVTASVVTLGAIAYLTARVGKRRKVKRVLGFIAYDREKNECVSVPGYAFATAVGELVKSATTEDGALRSQWNEQPLSKLWTDAHEVRCLGDRHEIGAQLKSRQLVVETAEHFVLSELSRHIVDYNVYAGVTMAQVQEVRRADMPSVLLENRVTDLLTRPMEDRAHFVGRQGPALGGVTGAQPISHKADGVIYDALGLVLPKGSKISRNDSQLVISTPKFTMTVQVNFSGSAFELPYLFDRFFLEPPVDALETELVVRVNFKRSALLSVKGIQYYRWIDSFVSAIDERVSANAFFEQINWRQTAGLLRALGTENGHALLGHHEAPDAKYPKTVRLQLVRDPNGGHRH